MTIERARNLVRQYTAVTEPAIVEQIAQRMVATNEGVWHSTAQVCGYADRCHCVPCEKARAIGKA